MAQRKIRNNNVSSGNPLIVFRIGYMADYAGIAEITGGGANVKKNKVGGEMWNFRADGGRCYGYVMTVNFSGINLQKLAPGMKLRPDQDISGIDIVFIATRPGQGQVVIGWYRNATIFHQRYLKRRGNPKKGDWENIEYLCECDAENVTLLPEKSRTFEIPRGKGMPGQSNVWYGEPVNSAARKLVAQLTEYIRKPNAIVKNPKSKSKGSGWRVIPDKNNILRIERAAVEITCDYFEKLGFQWKSVEKDNRGWDIELTKGGEKLLVEVKGHAGNVVQFELTPNEYRQMQENAKNYRICVVRNALADPDLSVFTPRYKDSVWTLVSKNGDETIGLTEKIGAKAATIL